MPRAGIIYHTNPEWLDFLIKKNQRGEVNFWTTITKAKLNIPDGELPFFFKIPGGRIAGMATYTRMRWLTIEEMWDEYGIANGRDSLEDLRRDYRASQYAKDGDPKMMCLILRDVITFKNKVDVMSFGLSKNLRMEYLDESQVENILDGAGILNREGKLLDPSSVEPRFKQSLITSRAFQGELRKLVLERYGSRCLICGIDNEDLLWVSHIKPVSEFPGDAGKVENTLLLCRLHDGMFDKNLISLDENHLIMVSSILKNSSSPKLQMEVKELENKTAVDILEGSKPFLEWHRTKAFRR